MPIHPGVLLIAAIAVLYLYDSVLLLHDNQGILTPSTGRKWKIRFGSHNFQILGKEPWLPNPLLPHRSQFLISWNPEPSTRHTFTVPPPDMLRPIAPLIWAIGIGLFVFLPLGFFTRLGHLMLWAAIITVYASIVCALLWVWFHRATLCVVPKKFAELAFEASVCPPFALNLIRHISTKVPIHIDLIAAGQELLDTEEWRACRSELLKRVASFMEIETEGTPRMEKLIELHRILDEEEGE